jgi:hypothetical protein
LAGKEKIILSASDIQIIKHLNTEKWPYRYIRGRKYMAAPK